MRSPPWNTSRRPAGIFTTISIGPWAAAGIELTTVRNSAGMIPFRANIFGFLAALRTCSGRFRFRKRLIRWYVGHFPTVLGVRVTSAGPEQFQPRDPGWPPPSDVRH